MPIINELYDNKYIGIYEEYGYRIIGKLALYHSMITGEDYDIVTDIKILDTNNQTVIYEVHNTHMAYDKKGLISVVNYAEKILFYMHHETCDIYWKRLFLDKLFTNMNTFKLDIYYKNKNRELKEEQQRKEVEQIRNNIDTLKEQIRNKYNQQGIAVFYNLFDIYLINESRIIQQQTDTNYINKNIKQYPDMYEPYILEHLELNWNESDIQILNKLLKEV